VHCTSALLSVLGPNSAVQAADSGVESCRPPRKSETNLALGRKQMAHNHGNEYQIKIVHEDGTEELSGWMNSEEQLAQAMAAAPRAQGKACWLRERNVLCPECFPKEQKIILECPITDIPSPRYLPHDSHYLAAVGSRNRYELL
jgi:hypothetical protein